MVPPLAVNQQIIFGIAFFLKPQAGQQIAAALIVRHVVSHNAMDMLRALHVANRRRQRLKHEPLSLPFLADGIPEIAGVKRPAYHV